jgi:diacylglycerol kinase (ATP)
MLGAEFARWRNTLRWSIEGWKSAWSGEKSLRQWSVVQGISTRAALASPLSGGEKTVIISLGFLVLAAELFNTAIEEVVDYISTAHDKRAKRAKDCASAGVFLVAMAVVVAWGVALLT